MMSKGRYTTGGARRTGNRKATGIPHYTAMHRKPIVGHVMHPTRTHGHGRAT